jgi:hypothetical protein
MKIAFRLMMSIALIALVMGCRDRAAEKRIAELESRLLQLEGGKTTASPAATAAPAAEAPPVQETKPDGPLPVIQYETVDHDFGTIKEGEKVSYTYKFKNTGDVALIIQNAQPSCGCTVPTWTKEPIPVGGTGTVTAEFDSSGKPGVQNKTITVTANTWPKVSTLRFKAMVTPKPAI